MSDLGFVYLSNYYILVKISQIERICFENKLLNCCDNLYKLGIIYHPSKVVAMLAILKLGLNLKF